MSYLEKLKTEEEEHLKILECNGYKLKDGSYLTDRLVTDADLLELLLKEVKQFLKVEEDFKDDDNEIRTLIISAKLYLQNAGCNVNDNNFLFLLALKMLVGHWYENKDVVGKADKLAYSLDNIITQLKYSYEDDTK